LGHARGTIAAVSLLAANPILRPDPSEELWSPPGEVLGETFFSRPSETVAPELIGKILWLEGTGGGRLVELEAYLPRVDPASHAYRGPSRRNEAMFGPPGRVYVYLSYGVHVLLNLVCEKHGVPSAVLVRAFEPLGATVRLRSNRGDTAGLLPLQALAAGPGRVGRALGLDLSWSGRELGRTPAASGLLVLDDGYRPDVEITRRIGISRGSELQLRFIVPGSPSLSRAPRRGEAWSGEATTSTGRYR
jgi:DNA-3-methyladenine glycosylase